MNESEVIRKAIRSIVESKNDLSNTTWAKVKSVSAQTCTITIDELDIENILLGFDKSGVIIFPKVNTDVLVVFIDNSKTNGAVIYVKETDKVEIMGNEYGGLGLTEKIAERLKRMEDSFDNLQTKFNTHLTLYNTHVHPGVTSGPSSTSTPPPDTSNVSSESVTPRTDQNYISSTKVTHGKG